MRNLHFFRTMTVIALLAIVGITIGCNTDSPSQAISETAAAPSVQSPADGQEPVGYEDMVVSEAAVLTSADPQGKTLLDEAAVVPAIQHLVDSITSTGYTYAEQHSFVVQGYARPDTLEDSSFVWIATLAFTCDANPSGRAAYIEYTVAKPACAVTCYLFSFTEMESDPTFRRWVHGVWRKELGAAILTDRSGTLSRQALTLDEYLDCVATRTAAFCIAAIIGCSLTGPAWPGCAAALCTTAFIGSAVYCLFTSL